MLKYSFNKTFLFFGANEIEKIKSMQQMFHSCGTYLHQGCKNFDEIAAKTGEIHMYGENFAEKCGKNCIRVFFCFIF